MSQAGAAAQITPFTVFRNRSFSLLWSAQLVSTVGSALTDLAAGIVVYRITGSALSVGLMLMASAIPTLILGLVAGAIVDRSDRKRIMVASDLARMVLVALIPTLIAINIVWLYLLVALTSGVRQFFDPANESVLPEIASDEELAAANSMIGISAFGSTAIGFAGAGLLASLSSIDVAFYVDAATFLASALLISMMRVPALPPVTDTGVSAVLANLRDGIRQVRGVAVLRSLFIIGLFVSVSFGVWNVLLLPFAMRALHASTFAYGLQEGLTSIGFVLGSLMMAWLAPRLREGQWIVAALIGMGVLGVLYGLATSIPYAIVLVMLSGALNAPFGVARRVLIQRNTSREIRGRVASTFFVSRDMVFLLGMAGAGIADVVPIRIVVVAVSLITLVTGMVAAALPGIGQPAAEWLRAIQLLRGAAAAPGLLHTRAAEVGDFDLLASKLPVLDHVTPDMRRSLAARTLVADAPAGTTILRRGDHSDAGYFVMEGQAVAGWDEEGGYRPLEVLNPGDFFGEIAALTGSARTANVVAQEDTTLLQVPAAVLRSLTEDPALYRLVFSKITERMVRMEMLDLPRYGGIDARSLRELRTSDAGSSPL